MDKIAIAPATDRRDLFQETAALQNISPVVIEKDFWVCWTLKRVAALENIGPNLIFKGGTSLSKVFGVIQRFSEDIDLSIRRDYLGFSGDNDPEQAASKTQQKKRVMQMRQKCQETIQGIILPVLQENFATLLGTEGWTLEGDPDDPNTINFTYPASLQRDARAESYIGSKVRLEMGASSDPYPVGTFAIKPYAAEQFPIAFQEPECYLTVLKAERTFWEKATFLHELYYRPLEKPTPLRITRHLYDLNQMANNEIGANAMSDLELLARVARHKEVYFDTSWAHYNTARPGSLHLVPSAGRRTDFARDYAGMRDMFFGPYPAFDELLAAIQDIEDRINAIQ